MAYREPTPEQVDEVLGHLVALGPGGGTWRDIFGMSRLPESTIRASLNALGKREQAVRTARPDGPGRGRQPDLWQATSEIKEREDA